jgi:tetratricopeptide (TPR) repeat protein
VWLALLLAGPAAADRRAQLPADLVAEALTPALAGEFALQSGKLEDAARYYLQAAEAVPGDVELAGRATRIAMLVNDNELAARAVRLWRRRAPGSLNVQGAEAVVSLRNGQARRARGQLEKLMRHPDPRGWRFALLALMGSRDPALSARVLSVLVEASAIPDDLNAWQEFGRLALRLDDLDLAGRMIDKVVERFPDEPGVILLRATQLQHAGKLDEARAALSQIRPLAAESADIRGLLAMSYESLGDYGEAGQIMAQGPQNTLSYGMRASLLARADDETGLNTLYEELQRDTETGIGIGPDRFLLLGKIAEYLERPEDAVRWYGKVMPGRQRTEAQMRTASVLHGLGRKQAAFAAAHAMQNDASLDDDSRRNAYLLEAEMLREDGDDAGEMDAYARALAAYPDDAGVLYARALAWERRDRIEHAEADLRRVLVSEPENTVALNALGYTLADRTDRYQEALELIGRARAAEPDNPAIVDSYGWVLYRLGRNHEAVAELRRAWTLMKDAEVAAHLGEVLWVMGQTDEAEHYFAESRKLDSQNRSLHRALQITGATLEPQP